MAGIGSRYKPLKKVIGYIFTDCGSEEKRDTFPLRDQNHSDSMTIFNTLVNQPFHYTIPYQSSHVTKSEVDQKIKEIGNDEDKTLKDVDGIILVFLMYGDHGVIYPSDCVSIDPDKGLNLNTLLEPLRANKCTALAGKPKIVIVQTKKPFEATDAVPSMPVTIPADADFLYLWSKLPDEKKGDIAKPAGQFITKLCKNIKADYKTDGLCMMMTRTIGDVCESIGESTNQTDHELPFFISQLREDVMLEGEE